MKIRQLKMAKFFNMLSSVMSRNDDPSQVKEVGSGKFGVWPVRRREDCLVLHGPHMVRTAVMLSLR